MNRRQKEVPTLEDALAKGFAVMQGEEEEPSKTPPLSNLESEDSVETVTQSKPDYRPPTQPVEHRTTFTVGPSSNPQTGDDKSTKQESNATEVLEKPSSTIGDDFDVEW